MPWESASREIEAMSTAGKVRALPPAPPRAAREHEPAMSEEWLHVRDGLDRLLPRLWRFCLVLTGDRPTADDLAQAACVRALEREAQYQRGTRLDRWLFRIAQTVWLNQLRSERVRRGFGLVPAEDAGLIDNRADAEANLYTAEVFAQVAALPEAQRLTVLLVYVEGYSYKEAAEHLEVPIGTVMSRLAAARSRLSAFRDEREKEGARRADQR